MLALIVMIEFTKIVFTECTLIGKIILFPFVIAVCLSVIVVGLVELILIDIWVYLFNLCLEDREKNFIKLFWDYMY